MEKDTDFIVLTFNILLKMDKKKPNVHKQLNSTTPLQQSTIEKKKLKTKELSKKTKGLRKKSWPQTWEGIQLLFASIDIKLTSRVLRMVKISKEHLLWCEEKMKKLEFSLLGSFKDIHLQFFSHVDNN